MATVTDPARELADLCVNLRGGGKQTGANHLAQKFGVSAWSAEFYQIIFTVSKRIDDLVAIVDGFEMDDDFKKDAVSHLNAIRNAFSQSGLNNPWSHTEEHYLNPTNVQPIKMLSPFVRKFNQYPKLDEPEVQQLVAEISALKGWLTEHQLADHDFIRQALLDGVTHLQFRLERIGWLGWGYTLESLREVIAAYMMLERGSPDLTVSPDATAALMKTKAVIVGLFEKARVSKDVYETGDFVLKTYGAASLFLKGAHIVGGLLTFSL